jgi:hypothetical protein
VAQVVSDHEATKCSTSKKDHHYSVEGRDPLRYDEDEGTKGGTSCI